MTTHRYERQGILALDPQAFFGLFREYSPPETKLAGTTAIVTVRGPLEQHAGGWCDSYEAIEERIDAALAGGAAAIVLRLDTPGGDVRGCFELARSIRTKCEAAGTRLVAYVEGCAHSAGYALACAAEHIAAAPSASVGSIGCIATRVDVTQADRNFGVRFGLITSGARKVYNNPHAELSEAELLETQKLVDMFAGSFFELVADARGLDVDAIAGLEAGVFVGQAALQLRLVDEVGSFDSLLAKVASGELAGASNGESTMSEDEKARAALQAIIDDEKSDEKAKARAKKALAAMDEDEKDEKKSKAEGDDDEEKDEKAKASRSVSASTAGELATRLAAVERQLEGQQRHEILASRPDLPEGLVKVLATKPVAEVQAIVAAIPAPKRPKLGEAAAASTAGGTRGEGQGDGKADRVDPALAAQMDHAMGVTRTKLGAKREGVRLYLGATIEESATK